MDGYARDNEGRCHPIADDDEDDNTAPTAPSVSLQPEDPRAQTIDLVCTITSESVDVDGDTVSYSFAWTSNDENAETDLASTHPGDTIEAERLTEGDVWECTVTPNDGLTDGPVATATATVTGGYVGWDEQRIQLSDADYTLIGEENGGCFGASMAPAGDLDHDGKMDIIIGDYWWNHPDEGTGHWLRAPPESPALTCPPMPGLRCLWGCLIPHPSNHLCQA